LALFATFASTVIILNGMEMVIMHKSVLITALFLIAFNLIIPLNSHAAASPKTLWSKAQKCLANGDELKACTYLEKLAKHPGSRAYKKAKALLQKKHGISIENPRNSYTIKQMFKLQNYVQIQSRYNGQRLAAGTYKRYKDAWGKPLRYEIVSKGGLKGPQTRSAGPDRRFMTRDDLILESAALKGGYKVKRKIKFSNWSLHEEKEVKGQKRSKNRQRATASQKKQGGKWMLPGTGGSASAPKQIKSGEESVSLDSLLNGN
jgi:hypothetical protein